MLQCRRKIINQLTLSKVILLETTNFIIHHMNPLKMEPCYMDTDRKSCVNKT